MSSLIKELLNKTSYSFYDLTDIMKILRSESGCPWDREQDHKTIRKNFIEETYEVCEAIDNNDAEGLKEELGDVLLQIVFHSRISEETEDFSIDDVIDGICKKLIYRHPHIFGSVNVSGTEDVLKNWDALKKVEKNQKTSQDVLNAVPKTLPALMYAFKLSEKASKNGFEFNDTLEDDFKFDENTGDEKIGEILFALASKCRINGIDPEKALYDYCRKFIDDFSKNSHE